MILTTDAISGVKKIRPQDVFQTEDSIIRGNTSRQLIDSSGDMIGVNTSMSCESADDIAIAGETFAVKSTQVKRWLDSQGINIAIGTSMKASLEFF